MSPAAGEIMDITAVNDHVFANKLVGDGFAVEPIDNIITAPCDGRVTFIASSNHALGLDCSGVEVLLHIGIDTVELGGDGFTMLVSQDDEVKLGDKLAEFDRSLLEAAGKQLTTMVVVTNMDDKVKKLEKNLAAADGIIMTVSVK